MERTFLEWNVVNWITITLMAFVGFAIVGGGVSLWRQYGRGGSGPVS